MNVQAKISADFPNERELVLERIFDAPREKVYCAWTKPKLLKQWFVPRPWTISGVSLDVRPGGSSLVVMRDPEGKDYPNSGIYLEVIENEKLVFTDAFTEAWQPSENWAGCPSRHRISGCRFRHCCCQQRFRPFGCCAICPGHAIYLGPGLPGSR